MRMNPESLVISRDGFCHAFHRRLEVLMTRVDVEPLLQDFVRRQLRERFDDRRLMCMVRADEDTVPLPAASPGWFDQDHHLTAEQVNGQSTEHPLGEEARVVFEEPEDPFVVERFHLRNNSGTEKCYRQSATGHLFQLFGVASTLNRYP